MDSATRTEITSASKDYHLVRRFMVKDNLSGRNSQVASVPSVIRYAQDVQLRYPVTITYPNGAARNSSP